MHFTKLPSLKHTLLRIHHTSSSLIHQQTYKYVYIPSSSNIVPTIKKYYEPEKLKLTQVYWMLLMLSE